jgi:hypothetical protein
LGALEFPGKEIMEAMELPAPAAGAVAVAEQVQLAEIELVIAREVLEEVV